MIHGPPSRHPWRCEGQVVVKISLVAAVADSRVIGHQGRLPWRIPADMARFKRLTTGKPIIMGRKTYESIGSALPGRQNIVVTTHPSLNNSHLILSKSIQDALLRAADYGSEVMIIGGAEIYASTLPMAQRIYLTEVHEQSAGDILFPNFDRTLWREEKREFYDKTKDTPAFSFVDLVRR